MKKFTRFMKRFMVANVELVATLLVIVLGAIVASGAVEAVEPTTAFVIVAILVAVFRYIGNLKTKASVEFLNRIDEADKLGKVAVKKDKVAVKKARQSVRADHKSKEAKAEAGAFLK